MKQHAMSLAPFGPNLKRVFDLHSCLFCECPVACNETVSLQCGQSLNAVPCSPLPMLACGLHLQVLQVRIRVLRHFVRDRFWVPGTWRLCLWASPLACLPDPSDESEVSECVLLVWPRQSICTVSVRGDPAYVHTCFQLRHHPQEKPSQFCHVFPACVSVSLRLPEPFLNLIRSSIAFLPVRVPLRRGGISTGPNSSATAIRFCLAIHPCAFFCNHFAHTLCNCVLPCTQATQPTPMAHGPWPYSLG